MSFFLIIIVSCIIVFMLTESLTLSKTSLLIDIFLKIKFAGIIAQMKKYLLVSPTHLH